MTAIAITVAIFIVGIWIDISLRQIRDAIRAAQCGKDGERKGAEPGSGK